MTRLLADIAETTFITVHVVNHVVLLATRYANTGFGALAKHVSCLVALVTHKGSRFVRVDLDQLIMIPDDSGKFGCGKCDDSVAFSHSFDIQNGGSFVVEFIHNV